MILHGLKVCKYYIKLLYRQNSHYIGKSTTSRLTYRLVTKSVPCRLDSTYRLKNTGCCCCCCCWERERDVLVDSAVRHLEAGWLGSIREGGHRPRTAGSRASWRRWWDRRWAPRLRATALLLFILLIFPYLKKLLLIFQLPIRTNPCCALKITVQCIRMIFSPLQFGRL